MNTFTQEGGQDKDGKDYDARYKVQLLVSLTYLMVILSMI